MSISSVGSSDPYARYRQQMVDLLGPPTQTGTQAPRTTAPSSAAAPADADDNSSNSFATKFKADLTSLNAKNVHGGHHAQSAASNPSDTATGSDATTSTDTVGQWLDQFANLLKSAAGIAAVVA
jgi:hypothetical protein